MLAKIECMGFQYDVKCPCYLPISPRGRLAVAKSAITREENNFPGGGEFRALTSFYGKICSRISTHFFLIILTKYFHLFTTISIFPRRFQGKIYKNIHLIIFDFKILKIFFRTNFSHANSPTPVSRKFSEYKGEANFPGG